MSKKLSTCDILSINFSKVNLEKTKAIFNEWIELGLKKRVCLLPVNCVLWAQKDSYLKDIYNSSDLNLADGVPIVWASRFLGNSIEGRVTGLDLLPEYCNTASAKGYSFFFMGAKEGVANQLAKTLLKKHPQLKIAGVYSPPFAKKFSEEENQKMIRIINEAKPNVLWVSLTAPKQDLWIYENLDKLDVNIAIGVGGAFEVTAGLISRAPYWMQNNGLEWLYRFIKEPRRLFRRYFIEAPIFIPLIFKQRYNIK